MDRKTWTKLVAPLAVVLLVPCVAAAEDAERMQAWLAAMTPGQPHEGLKDQAGEWRYVVTIWEDPDSEPTRLKGVSTKTMIMGGRYLKEELSGEYHEQPFHGFGLTGYDNVTGEYVAIWLDNMSTGIHFYTGQENRRGHRVYESKSVDPLTRQPVYSRSVGRVIDRDHHTFESFVKQPDGSEQLQMRVEYTRASR